MKTLTLAFALTLSVSTAFADENCPTISGTYQCGENSSIFYIDVFHFHPKVDKTVSDLYQIYYRYRNPESAKSADAPIIPITLMTGTEYSTKSKLNNNEQREDSQKLMVQATCQKGDKVFVMNEESKDTTSKQTFDSRGRNTLAIRKYNSDESYTETTTIALSGRSKIIYAVSQTEKGLDGKPIESAPSIETCSRLYANNPNYSFGRKSNGQLVDVQDVNIEIKKSTGERDVIRGSIKNGVIDYSTESGNPIRGYSGAGNEFEAYLKTLTPKK